MMFFIPTKLESCFRKRYRKSICITIEEKEKRPEGEVIEVIERHKTDLCEVDIQLILLLSLPIQNVYIFIPKDKIGE
jgi:ribonuclease R